jgi:phosphoenolpyruvate carboxykinase (GTP)
LRNWVRDIAELTNPDRVEWCDGTRQEWDRLTAQLVDAGTLRRLDRKPNSLWAVSDPADVARVE